MRPRRSSKTFDAGHASMNQGWSGTMEQLEAYLAKAKSLSQRRLS